MSETGLPRDDRRVRDPAKDLGDAWLDVKTLEGVRRRDATALGDFFDAVFPYVYNLAFRLMGNREAAEDVTQDVFLKVYKAADRLLADRDPRPWLTAITYNTCRDAARRSAARPEVVQDAAVIGERHADGSTPEELVLRKEREKLAEMALLRLDEESRAIVILHDFCGTAHEEIAQIMGITHPAVRKRYSRALKRMAETIRGLQQ